MGNSMTCCIHEGRPGSEDANALLPAVIKAMDEHDESDKALALCQPSLMRSANSQPSLMRSANSRHDLAPRPTPRDEPPLAPKCEKQTSFANAYRQADRAAEALAHELAEAHETAAQAERRKHARRSLAEAMHGREEAALRLALGLADEASLDASEVREAVKLIEKLDEARLADGCLASARRAQAADHLTRAIQRRCTHKLEAAIDEAKDSGLCSKTGRALLAEARLTHGLLLARQLVTKERLALDRAGPPLQL
mmetsp:Transcript_23507/g.66502  ORF Transcript_23507/g.66502 Transcript_23507/m.66502 type:complete len:254 (+) Transcript_23507:2-763(+)